MRGRLNVRSMNRMLSSVGILLDKESRKCLTTRSAQPCNVQEVRQFYGLVNYYRRFIRHFSIIAAPLSDLFKSQDNDKRKRCPIIWSTVHQVAFERLKNAITSAPVLVQPDPTKPYTIETDSSDFGNGMTLYQEYDDGKLHPVAFDGQKLHGAELRYPTHEKELLAILFQYILNPEFSSGSSLSNTFLYGDQAQLISSYGDAAKASVDFMSDPWQLGTSLAPTPSQIKLALLPQLTPPILKNLKSASPPFSGQSVPLKTKYHSPNREVYLSTTVSPEPEPHPTAPLPFLPSAKDENDFLEFQRSVSTQPNLLESEIWIDSKYRTITSLYIWTFRSTTR